MASIKDVKNFDSMKKSLCCGFLKIHQRSRLSINVLKHYCIMNIKINVAFLYIIA